MFYKDPIFWRKKLSALMHDSPGKVLQIWDHYQRASELQLPDNFEDYEFFDHKADHDASAADRLPFPKPIRSSFDGVKNFFRHPMGGNVPFKFDLAFQSVSQAEESGQVTRPSLLNNDDPKGEFLQDGVFGSGGHLIAIHVWLSCLQKPDCLIIQFGLTCLSHQHSRPVQLTKE